MLSLADGGNPQFHRNMVLLSYCSDIIGSFQLLDSDQLNGFVKLLSYSCNLCWESALYPSDTPASPL